MPSKARAVSHDRRICNLVPSKGTETDWSFGDAVMSGALTAPKAAPESKDLRRPWWKVGDQENTGSCVGWAATDGLMRYHLVHESRLGQSELLSPRYTWMASKESDEFMTRPETFIEEAGTSLKAAVDVCRKYGVVLESMLPFHLGTLMYVGSEGEFYAAAAQRRAAAYFNLHKNLAQWRSWLTSNGPILAGVHVDATWDNATATHGLLDVFQPSTVRGGHAVCVVGYRKDGRFIVRNSWGNGWGDKGFAYASEAYVKGAFFEESYGVKL